MTKYRCQKGCTQTNGRPMWHQRTAECPFEPNYAGPAVGTPTPAGTADAAKAPPQAVTATAPPQPEAKGPRTLSFGARPAQTTTRTSPATVQAKPDFEVDADHSLSFFQLIDTIAVKIINIGDKFFEVDPFKGNVILNSGADEALVQKKFGRSFVTRVTKALGATTQEEAHAIIDSGGVIVLVAGGFMSVAAHVWSWKDSPKVKKWREERKKPKVELTEEMKAAGMTVAPGKPQLGSATA